MAAYTFFVELIGIFMNCIQFIEFVVLFFMGWLILGSIAGTILITMLGYAMYKLYQRRKHRMVS
jgi:type III secretory pathway component EscU